MFAKILIANRGESACRVAGTCRRLGIAAATVHSSADRDALHVRAVGESVEVGGAAPRESYLNREAIVAAALATGAAAVHPGIGFLSEDPAFARAVEGAGLAFIGPTPATLEGYADKWAAKREARAAGVPVLDGSEGGSADPARLARLVGELEPPVLLKALAGGGGRGMRVVRDLGRVDEVVASAMREAEAAFGRPELLVEAFVEKARHVEVQVAGDGEGGVIHLFERECSLQRRHQKVVEEAPAPGLGEALRTALTADACRLAERARLRGIATVEFLVSGDGYHFLEVNPRLQVEHPVTEMVTGLDLVELQLRIAAGEGLPLEQGAVTLDGHAIEARIYAEDPANDFAPSAGVVRSLSIPPAGGVRVDTGVADGEAITPHYDPMLAKVIAHGDSRGAALARLTDAVRGASVLGVATNLPFLSALLGRPEVIAGRVDTGFIDRRRDLLVAGAAQDLAAATAIAATLWLAHERRGPATDPWAAPGFTGWRLGPGAGGPTRQPALAVSIAGTERGVALSRMDGDGAMTVAVDDEAMVLRVVAGGGGRFRVTVDDRVLGVRAVVDDGMVYLGLPAGAVTASVAPWTSPRAGGGRAAGEGRLLAPVMGRVVKVNVRGGETVNAGDVLVVQESMKMELRIAAPCAGVVVGVHCREGEMVERHGLVAEVRPESTEVG